MGAGVVSGRQLSLCLSRSGQVKRRAEAPADEPHPPSLGPGVGPGETQPTKEPTQAGDAEPGGPGGLGNAVGRRKGVGQPKVRPGRGRGGAPIRGRR
jgi:hypothetical protein